LYTQYSDKNFIIIGFPANNFLSQEPGADSTIKEFCEINYGVTFPMMSKISVKGKDIAPIYAYLTQKKLNGYADTDVSWNFQKYAINEQGYVVRMWSPKVSPLAPDIVSWITE
jgi:glutathione peroxidase